MTTPPRDLTDERAAAEDVYYGLQVMNTPDYNLREADMERDIQAIITLIRQTRQEALREARDYALACVAERDKQAFELTETVLNDPRAVWLGCKASEAERIAEWLDRLASEGG